MVMHLEWRHHEKLIAAQQLKWKRWRRLLLRAAVKVTQDAYQAINQALTQTAFDTGSHRHRRVPERQRQPQKELPKMQAADDQYEDDSPNHRTTTTIHMINNENRLSPVAMVFGNGGYLKPIIPSTFNCKHATVTAGTNSYESWTVCSSCRLQVNMPKILNEKLHEYNWEVVTGQTKAPYYKTQNRKTPTSQQLPPEQPAPQSHRFPTASWTPTSDVKKTGPLGIEPQCPLCGAHCITKQNRQDQSFFWGCHRYPSCQGTLPIKMDRAAQRMMTPLQLKKDSELAHSQLG